MAAELDVSRFYARLGRLHAHFLKHRDGIWQGAGCLSLHRGQMNDDEPYLKSVVLHQYLFGWELPDTILLLTETGDCFVLAAKKKCEFLEAAVGKTPTGSSIIGLTLLTRNKSDGNAENYETLMEAVTAKNGSNGDKKKVGVLMKEWPSEKRESIGGPLVSGWEKSLTGADGLDVSDATPGLSLFMSIKEDSELDLMKKSSVLSNKILKHGFIKRIEEVIDSELNVTHTQLSGEIDGIIEDPSKINLKVPKEHVQSCYFPIVQSGGEYDIKISAQSTEKSLKYDIVTVSLGSRYQNYCSNVARTFLVDPPKEVSETYEVLLSMQEECLRAMVPGRPLKSVYATAVNFLKSSEKSFLVRHLPKNLGFSIGLDFRDPNLVLSAKNSIHFRPGMVFTLSVGFAGVPLSDSAKSAANSKSAVKDIKEYGLLISDMVVISENSKSGEVMTKHGKSLTDISYTINDDDDSSDDDDNGKGGAATNGDEEYARKVAKAPDNVVNGKRRSSRLESTNEAIQNAHEGTAERERRQIALMTRKNEERLRELARSARNKGDDGESDKAEELRAYDRTKDYPDSVLPNQVKVDMVNQCVILPICGNPVPFHISTIKNVVLPDPDSATYLRINFYTAGMAVGKDAPANMAKLVQKYAPYASFIREMTFRSLDSHNLTQAFRQISELRKRARQKELRELEEANLVKQAKLVRTKTERVPRLSDLTMRPVFAGRKTQGNLEAHSNGLRFISMRGEIVDIMYPNIKHAIFQPCENEIMVLVHFHLRHPIMLGKKKQQDIQFFTEVIDASQTVDAGRRSMYDPDEMDDEQRERQLRRKLNEAFKEFCRKVENVAKKNGFSLEFDIPYRDLGFNGNPHKEMVFIQPTLNCLVNLTETPFFVVNLSDVDHVHFERVTFMSKAFDIVLINKDFSKQPWRVDMIPNDDKESIQVCPSHFMSAVLNELIS
uniref:FACT complex subunit n=1 Tax=Ditylum brightwellii TaxID=49249 RepID=A0A6V2I6E2_9STRA|mmetsp:Transcript_7429/g.9851  ORF Transcript_7429/g.9851 Transcript_7429/m.9851 type:complete len:947 (-) Transcript_7429:654-3494(-)